MTEGKRWSAGLTAREARCVWPQARPSPALGFDVADDAEGTEVPVWLAVLNGAHEILKQDMLCASQTY